MIREEAIRWLNDRKAKYLELTRRYPCSSQLMLTTQVIDMAIEALSVPQTDLISRAEAVKAIRKCKFESDMPSDWYKGMETAQDILSALPSADAVEVVRCKDCKHYVDAGTTPNKSCCGFCTKLGSVSYYGVDANDFCSFGERREP